MFTYIWSTTWQIFNWPSVLAQQNQMIIKGIKYINNPLVFKTQSKKLFLKNFRKNV